MSKQGANEFQGRVGLQQRVLPSYRVAFFEALATACRDGLSIFAGQPRPQEAIQPAEQLTGAHYVPARNLHLLGGSLYVCWQRGLLSWLEAWDPQALIVEANPRYLSTPRAVKWMHARQRPVIGWGLGAPPLSGPLAASRERRRQAFLGSLDAVIAYSQQGAEQYRALGLPPERVFVATNAVARRPTSPPPARPAHFEGLPTVLFIGRLQERKRLDLLLEACAALASEQEPRLLIVGDGPARPQFEALAEEVYPSAEFLGARHGPQLTPLFAQADLFVLPGTGGLAVQQAMAHALPVIVAEGDGTQNDLVRPANGWLIPPNDLAALTRTLGEALSDSQRLRKMGTASFQLASEEINVEAMVKVFTNVLNLVALGPVR
jgi:glycosyltransferase involved in cell wall biosynthesis